MLDKESNCCDWFFYCGIIRLENCFEGGAQLEKILYEKIKKYIERNYKIEELYMLCQKKFSEIESLEIDFDQLDDSFSKRLLRLIEKKSKKEVEVYKKAGVDRKLFSKIKNNIDYHPKKNTVVAFIFALELSTDDAEDLLLTAGYALSNSSKSDLIIKYFLENKIYDIFELNDVLFEFEQPTIGV